jgi:hypothetical protein
VNFRTTQSNLGEDSQPDRRRGLITRGRVAQTRVARIAPAPLDSATRRLLRYREFWEGSFDRLDGYLEDLQKDPGTS